MQIPGRCGTTDMLIQGFALSPCGSVRFWAWKHFGLVFGSYGLGFGCSQGRNVHKQDTANFPEKDLHLIRTSQKAKAQQNRDIL